MATTHTGCASFAYYNSGTEDSPTWVPIPMAQDATVNSEASELEASTREGGCFKLSASGLIAVSADMSLLYQPGETAFDFLRAAHLAKTTVSVAFMDGAIATVGSEGMWFVGEVFAFPVEQPLDGVLVTAMTIKPTNNAAGTAGALVIPTWNETTV